MLEFLFCKFVGLELYKKQAPAQSFSSEYREIFESTYFEKRRGTIFLGLNFQGGGAFFSVTQLRLLQTTKMELFLTFSKGFV